MNVDLSPVPKVAEPLWKLIKQLFSEHHFITILCAFFVVMMLLSCYKFLRSISPALVVLICALVIIILLMHWTATRTEPEFLTPFVDHLAPFLPTYNIPVPPPPKR
ncbi:MAG: hypothetical protein Q7S40_13185 [Opitutaceae bacterium]|nr:hypothetical protein [Opitutaceae bacterium]